MQTFTLHSAEIDMWKFYLRLKEKNQNITFPESVLIWITAGRGEQFRKAWLSPKSYKQLN